MRIIQILLLFFYFSAQAQHLYEPKEILQSIENNTRTRSGIPGADYWQNKSSYTINATFSPDNGIIHGHVNLLYTNNSLDTLKHFYFKLMQNIYAKGSARAWEVASEGVHNGIVVSNVYVDSTIIDTGKMHLNSTLLRIDPVNFLPPHQSQTIQMDFEVPMQKNIQYRTGALDSVTLFAGYWFPQICVYDDVFGWDKEQYMLNTENYNDFSDYDVSLTLPGNFVVWATGQLQNTNDLFQAKIIKRIKKSKKSKQQVSIIEQTDLNKKAVLQSNDSLTWNFKASQVPDFAWGASTHLLWDAASSNTESSKQETWVQAVYPVGNTFNPEILKIAKKSLVHFTTDFPGIVYPYPEHITFLGGMRGGMEFPMIANNSESDSAFAPIMTCHEIAHNYFPFSMGINERKFGWMDEMFTTQMENSFLKKQLPVVYKNSLRREKYFARNFSGSYSDLPLMTESSSAVKQTAMLYNFYIKPNDMLKALKSIIGEESFKQYLKEFMITWEGKHPTPYDFFYSINYQSLNNLNWFWDRWAFQFGYVDLSILNADSTQTLFNVENLGGRPVPLKMEIEYMDGSLGEEIYNADIWKNNKQVVWQAPDNKKPKKITIKVENEIMEGNEQNNTFELDVSIQN